MLALRLLGPPQILLDGHALDVTRRKSRALLYYLAADSKPVARDQLLTLFWADLDRPAAQRVLRTTLHGLRKELGPALLVSDDSVALAPDADVDTRQLERSLMLPVAERRTLATALDHYRGDFLTLFSLADTPAFDDWMSIERERYRRLAVRGLAILALRHEVQHEICAAIEVLDRALALEPLQEQLQRMAMRLHYQDGDRTSAIRRYEHLRQLLDEELGVPPMPETQALYHAIITDTLAPDRATRWQADRLRTRSRRRRWSRRASTV